MYKPLCFLQDVDNNKDSDESDDDDADDADNGEIDDEMEEEDMEEVCIALDTVSIFLF